LTRSDLNHRVGDAGPFFYVPDARCERAVTHELATVITDFGVDDPRFHALNAGFQNPPIFAESSGSGQRIQWKFLHADLPLSSLFMIENRILARFYNPTPHPSPLPQPCLMTDVHGNPQETLQDIPSKHITTILLEEPLPAIHLLEDQPKTPINIPAWRVGSNQGRPDPQVIQGLNDKITNLEEQISKAAEALGKATGLERYRWQHRIYVFERELFEYRLSVLLNERKLASPGHLSYDYLFYPDEEIAEIGLGLNRLRIKRRIYDYVIQTD
jgi:hypothetical protein